MRRDTQNGASDSQKKSDLWKKSKMRNIESKIGKEVE